jgi:hypothetical protein
MGMYRVVYDFLFASIHAYIMMQAPLADGV